MPTLLNQDGLKFFFYANEHDPKHVHVVGADGFAKFELGTLRVVQEKMSPVALKRALKIARENNLEFERKWDEFFNW
jgi:hypothetical protein